MIIFAAFAILQTIKTIIKMNSLMKRAPPGNFRQPVKPDIICTKRWCAQRMALA